MFLLRPASLRDSVDALQRVEGELGEVERVDRCSPPACRPSSGLPGQPTRASARSVKSWVSTISVAPLGTSPMLAFSAAGFIATRTSGRSPGVRMSWSAKCSWNDETPASVPCGARISAGKFGKVDRSLPKIAVSWVNRSPVSCMPSPESPAIRMTTWSSCSTSLDMRASASELPRPCGPYRSAAVPGGSPIRACVLWSAAARPSTVTTEDLAILRAREDGRATLLWYG